MSNKDKCKEIMLRLFGESAASQVDDMTEDTVVQECKQRVSNFLGSEIAEKEFTGL